MAIKFRRIEDRKESVAQLRRREAGRRERSRVLPKVVILLVAIVAVVAWFAWYNPPRIVAPFIVDVEAAQVSCPVSGTLTWVIGRETKRVQEGDVIARVNAQPETSDSALARLTELRLRAQSALAEVKTRQAGRDFLDAQLQGQERELQVTMGKLREEAKQAEARLRETRRVLEDALQDLAATEELKGLAAATEQDYVDAQRAAAAARTAHEVAESRLRALGSEIQAAEDTIKDFQEVRQMSLASAEDRVEAAESTHKALLAAAEPQEAAFADAAGQYIVRAPVSGMLFEVPVTDKSYVERGQFLVSIYEPASKLARAYVPVRYRDGLKVGAAARLDVEGRDRLLSGEVAKVNDQVVPLPASLERRLRRHEGNVIPVDIRITEPSDGTFLPGDTGDATIER